MSSKKVQAIQQAWTPKNVQELCLMIVLINYYGRFIPNLAAVLHPLHKLLYTNKPGPGPGNVRKPLKRQIEAGDASPYGVRAVVSHISSMGKSTLLPMSLPYWQQASKIILHLIHSVLHNNGPTMLQILNKEVLKRMQFQCWWNTWGMNAAKTQLIGLNCRCR